jgi:NADH-quinone oxidoreductase subunit N
LVIVAIGMSAVSLYYYLQVLKQIYVAAPPADSVALETPVLSLVLLGLLAFAVLALGCAPNLLLGKLLTTIHLAGSP